MLPYLGTGRLEIAKENEVIDVKTLLDKLTGDDLLNIANYQMAIGPGPQVHDILAKLTEEEQNLIIGEPDDEFLDEMDYRLYKNKGIIRDEDGSTFKWPIDGTANESEDVEYWGVQAELWFERMREKGFEV